VVDTMQTSTTASATTFEQQLDALFAAEASAALHHQFSEET
jgi:hypothetical protein